MEFEESGQRGFLGRILAEAAERLEVELAGEPVFGWHDRTIGAPAARGTEMVWLRATGEHKEWTAEAMWTGNQDAAALTGLAKPTLLNRVEWEEPPVVIAAELMTLVADPVCSATPELHQNLDLPDSWWAQLARALVRLQAQSTPRLSYNRDNFERSLRIRFGPWVDLDTPIAWVTAHCDLHWANLTSPTLAILDWETWGVAPQGIHAARLYCSSLLVPPVARKVHDAFRGVLDTPAGQLAQLSVIDHLLDRCGQGDHPDLVVPLHRLADRLLGRQAPEGR